MKKREDLISIYKNYLHCLEYIKEYGNKYGDVSVKDVYTKSLKLQNSNDMENINKKE